MAPSRRRGMSKAAAAAAARGKWKVGDLVLAKVKGFPAWPATVSEPEKWGYKSDWKKVLVYFFGTQQIAFCRPADVEAFTEEKKQSLLVKRNGADFVRAVHEIIDCFEKLKKEQLPVNVNSTDEVNVRSENTSIELIKTHVASEAPTALESSSKEHPGDKNDPDPLNEAGVVDAKEDASHDSEMLFGDPSSNVKVIRMPATKTYSTRRQVEGGGSINGSVERRAPSARRLRSSLRSDPEKLQNHALSSSSYSRNAGYGANAVRERSTRRNRRARNSSDTLDMHDMDSPVFVSNGSMEENDSEIATVDSDSLSLNESSSVESGCKPESRCVVHCEAEVDLSQRLEFQSSTVILKKKRKPNRKRLLTDSTESSTGFCKETAPEVLTPRTVHVLPSDPVKSNENISKELKEDGDEHLPLVKRARVRMSRSEPEGEVLDNMVQNEVKSPGDFDKSLEQVPEGDGSFCQNSVKGDAYDSSPSKKCVLKSTFWEVRKQFGSSLDGESALPPSKRLHRALEAMSAYAAEDDKTDMDAPSRMKTFINGYCSPSKEDCAELSEGNKLENESRVVRLENTGCVVQEDVTQFSVTVNEGSKHLAEVLSCTTPLGDNESSKKVSDVLACTTPLGKHLADVLSCTTPLGDDESSKKVSDVLACTTPLGYDDSSKKVSDVLACTTPLVYGDSSKELSCEDKHEVFDTAVGALQRGKSSSDCPSSTSIPHPADAKSDGSELQNAVNSDHWLPGSDIPFNENSENEVAELSKHLEGPRAEVSGQSADCGSNNEVMTCSPEKGSDMQMGSSEVKCGEHIKLSQVSLDGINQDNEKSINVKEAGSISKCTSAIVSSSSEKAVGVSQKELPMSGSTSDALLGDKAVSTTLSSSSLTDGMDSFARASTPNTLPCNMSTVDNSVHLSNGCCSPLPRQLHDKPRVVGKLSGREEANVVLGSFEATLGSLTRTKESIGRATRIAIDCAKLGVASKVVEILAHNLETESSLHRRVDLFFLVDSIAQFSGGLKGHISGIYHSKIQRVLPRLLLAAAPPGSNSQENRRQCLKVLRVWQERKILPESVIRPHIRELESFCGIHSSGAISRRLLRTERSFDDPVREMEGMLVDEYGSNSSFQLPGFRMPPMLKDEEEGSDSDGESFEAVTPEHPAGTPKGEETSQAIEKRKHILEDVDGELEMEDVAPTCESEIASSTCSVGMDPALLSCPDYGNSFGVPFHPPLPKDGPPSSPPLPMSPPPSSLTPAPSSFPPSASISNSISSVPDAKFWVLPQNVKDNLGASVFQQSTTPKMNSTVSDAFHQPADRRDIPVDVPLKVLDSSCSRLSLCEPVSHPPVCLSNGVQPPDGASSKGFHLRPPHPAPSNQFSYVQADQRRDIEIPYSNRFHMQNADNGNFYRDRNGMKFPRENGECWTTPSHYSGPCYPDSTRRHHAAGPYAGPREPHLPSHRWAHPPRPMNHNREFFTHRPHPDGPISVTSRGPGFWKPR